MYFRKLYSFYVLTIIESFNICSLYIFTKTYRFGIMSISGERMEYFAETKKLTKILNNERLLIKIEPKKF
ncbi:hypothetical protein BFX48_08160 [Lactobacillus jensenii]|nr:hypothetical protein BFX48_08160 [Lactobacillus jensenii]